MEYLGSISDSKSHVTKEYVDDAIDKKADKDGVYPDMTVGMTRDMLGVGEGDEGEFLFRPTDGDGSIKDGFASIERIEGNSVVWNQKNNNSWIVRDGTMVSENGVYTITPTGNYPGIVSSLTLSSGNKYLLLAHCAKEIRVNLQGSESVANNTGNFAWLFLEAGASNTTTTLYTINVTETFTISNVVIVDLTRMFGAGNEPSTVEEFYQRIPKGIDINAYNEGEVVNMTVNGIKSVGFNLWDGDATIEDNSDAPSYAVGMEESALRTMKKIMFLSYQGNTIHYTCDVQGQIAGQRIGAMKLYKNGTNVAEILPNLGDICINLFADIEDILNADSCVFYGTNLSKWKVSDICIHLVHTGYRNGEYEPYVSDEIALPIADYFPNGMNSIGDVKDELTATEAIQRIGVVDMGTLDWFYHSGSSYPKFSTQLVGMTKKGESHISANLLSARYTTVALEFAGSNDREIYKEEDFLGLFDSSYTDVASFKAAMSGVMLYYELAEPIVTSIDEPLDLDYQVWDFGTEEAIAEGKTTPLKASIIYEFNARDTIRANKLALKNKADKTYVDNAIAQAIISTINANY